MVTEDKLQTAVYQIELGGGKRVVQWAALVVFAVFFGLVLYPASQFIGLEKREAMDMAQLARNIARGQGFQTYTIRPLSLWQMKTYGPDHDPRIMDHPDLYNPPLYPLVLAGLFKLVPETVFRFIETDRVFAPERWVILPFNALCLLASILLVYFWARQLFDNRVAIMAGFLLLLSDTLWSYGISGLPTTFLTLLLLVTLYCLNLADRRLNPPVAADAQSAGAADAANLPKPTGLVAGLLLASAVLMGLCFLTRYSAAFLLLPVVVYVARIFRRRRAWLWTAIFLAVFVAVISPWLVRNSRVSGSMLGIAKYDIGDGDALQRTYKLDPKDAYGLNRLARKFMEHSRKIMAESVKQIGSDYFIVFFATGLMYGFRRRDTSRLRWTVVGCIVCAGFGMALIGWPPETRGDEVNGANLLVLFLPLVAVFGIAFFFLLLDRIAFESRLARASVIGLFALINVSPMIFTLLPPGPPNYPYPPYLFFMTQKVAAWFKPDEVGVSDLPWAMAWNGDRRTVWLPMTVEEFYDIHDYVAPRNTAFVMLTQYMLDRKHHSELAKGEYKSWAPLLFGQLQQEFPLKVRTALPPAGEQLLLVDRPRWTEQQVEELAEPAKPQEGQPTAEKPSSAGAK